MHEATKFLEITRHLLIYILEVHIIHWIDMFLFLFTGTVTLAEIRITDIIQDTRKIKKKIATLMFKIRIHVFIIYSLRATIPCAASYAIT